MSVLKAETLILKIQICAHLQSRALAGRPNKFLKHIEIKTKIAEKLTEKSGGWYD